MLLASQLRQQHHPLIVVAAARYKSLCIELVHLCSCRIFKEQLQLSARCDNCTAIVQLSNSLACAIDWALCVNLQLATAVLLFPLYFVMCVCHQRFVDMLS